ncbi:MAG: hypothetical protein C5B53_10440 [Candidatus Melainabacteria bacterium]|nr:MAG: hypothetical protein C5B53_10440 [Candidatus Melainabacteria bacterium]
MPEIAPKICEDLAYTKQFFTVTRKGHTSPTAEFGAPAVAWHVSFWPLQKNDPHAFPMVHDGGQIKSESEILGDFKQARQKVISDFNGFLANLQARGRVPDAPFDPASFRLNNPKDWQASIEPFHVSESETTSFTLWWPDDVSGDGNVIASRPPRKPIQSDLRIQVQAEAHADYSSITFIIDAGKPWNDLPSFSLSDVLARRLGRRRETIYKHVENIRTICETRLEAEDQFGKRLIDMELLPEPNPICGTTLLSLHLGYTDAAEALKGAADYLYDLLWKEFCTDFGFNLCDIAGNTGEVFANFRGLVLSTCGAVPAADGLAKATRPDPASTSAPGTKPFPRFDGGGEGFGVSKPEPNAIVKAFMPFLRRFRSEGDWRDWIASGILDWRAIYITPIGAQSEFAPFDDCEFDPVANVPGLIPAGHLPRRRADEHAIVDIGADCGDWASGRETPTTASYDLPAPFRYLLLTKFEPNRKQVGRMIERINALGDHRLFALKNWSVIQNAGVWINHFGRELDEVYRSWISETEHLERDIYLPELEKFNKVLWQPLESSIAALSPPEIDSVRHTLARYRDNPRRACEELETLATNCHLSDHAHWAPILKFAQDNKDRDFPRHRTIEGDYDADVAAINQRAERGLIRITAGLDQLSIGAVGGLPYRIARARYHADTFRETVRNLRVGNIETWWSYEQFARRGMEPAFREIESVGERMAKLRERLQSLKQDILQSSIASQTAATRDNTHRLERIQAEIRRMADEAHEFRMNLIKLQMMSAENDVGTSQMNKSAAEVAKAAALAYQDAAVLYKRAARWYTWKAIGAFFFGLLGGALSFFFLIAKYS